MTPQIKTMSPLMQESMRSSLISQSIVFGILPAFMSLISASISWILIL